MNRNSIRLEILHCITIWYHQIVLYRKSMLRLFNIRGDSQEVCDWLVIEWQNEITQNCIQNYTSINETVSQKRLFVLSHTAQTDVVLEQTFFLYHHYTPINFPNWNCISRKIRHCITIVLQKDVFILSNLCYKRFS